MIVLHGSWLPQGDKVAGQFILWGETGQDVAQAPRARGRPRKAPGGLAAHAHPFAATITELIAALPDPELRDAAVECQLLARLPTIGGEPQPSRPFLRERTAEGAPELAGALGGKLVGGALHLFSGQVRRLAEKGLLEELRTDPGAVVSVLIHDRHRSTGLQWYASRAA